jgi:hypothetical protein
MAHPLIYDRPKDENRERIKARIEYLMARYTRPEWKHRNPDQFVNHPDFIEYRQLLREIWK